MKRYVIVGNGVAAANCIEGIRSVDTSSEIVVISEEKYAVYFRPLISYYLEGRTDENRMHYRPEGFYEKNNCKVLYGKTATKIDPNRHSVLLDDGTGLPYDRLCIATGSRPFSLPVTGIETAENVNSFLTMDDALALETTVGKTSDVLIIGAGLIGLKCAEGLAARAGHITVCNRSPQVLSKMLDPESAELVQRHMESSGMRFRLGAIPQRIEGKRAYMNDGTTEDFDVLVVAAGVQPNMELVRDAGGETGKGIAVNERMETSIENIFAAGDCSESIDISDGNRKVMAILPNAVIQGRCAGINMAGGNDVFQNAIPMNSSGFFGLHVMSAGTYGGEVYEEKTKTGRKRLFTKGGRLTGFIIIGDVERSGIYTSLIREQTRLDSVAFEMLKKTPTLFPLGNDYRGKLLGGVV